MKGVVPALAVALAVWGVLAGCRGSGPEAPRPVAGPAREVAAVVEGLERATVEKDFTEICFELFSDEVRAQAGGVRCPAFLRRTARDIEAPSIQIADPPGGRTPAIVVRGPAATVRVRTKTRDQPPVNDTIQLVRQRGRFRISALGEQERR